MLDNIIPRVTSGQDDEVLVPRVSAWLVRLFSLYVFHYMERSFHAVRLSREGTPQSLPDLPVIV